MTNQQIVDLCLATMTIATIVASVFLVPLLKTKLGQAKLNNIDFWVTRGVKAAEKLFPQEKMGTIRKAYVVKYLNSKGINLTKEDLEVLLNAGIKDMEKLREQLVTTAESNTDSVSLE